MSLRRSFGCALLLLPCCLLLLSACGSSYPHTRVYPLEEGRDRAPTSQVDVYLHPDSLQRPHREIAIIHGRDRKLTYKVDAELDDLVAAMQEEARALGADAIVIFRGSYTPKLSSEDMEEQARSAHYRREINDTEDEYRAYIQDTDWSLRAKAVVYE